MEARKETLALQNREDEDFVADSAAVIAGSAASGLVARALLRVTPGGALAVAATEGAFLASELVDKYVSDSDAPEIKLAGGAVQLATDVIAMPVTMAMGAIEGAVTPAQPLPQTDIPIIDRPLSLLYDAATLPARAAVGLYDGSKKVADAMTEHGSKVVESLVELAADNAREDKTEEKKDTPILPAKPFIVQSKLVLKTAKGIAGMVARKIMVPYDLAKKIADFPSQYESNREEGHSILASAAGVGAGFAAATGIGTVGVALYKGAKIHAARKPFTALGLAATAVGAMLEADTGQAAANFVVENAVDAIASPSFEPAISATLGGSEDDLFLGELSAMRKESKDDFLSAEQAFNFPKFEPAVSLEVGGSHTVPILTAPRFDSGGITESIGAAAACAASMNRRVEFRGDSTAMSPYSLFNAGSSHREVIRARRTETQSSIGTGAPVGLDCGVGSIGVKLNGSSTYHTSSSFYCRPVGTNTHRVLYDDYFSWKERYSNSLKSS